MKKETKKLGELLLEAGLIDEFQLKSSLAEQGMWGGRLGSIIIKKGFVSEKDMLSVIEKQYGLSVISLDTIEKPSEEVLKMVGAEVAKKFGIFPLGMEKRALLIAVADPTDLKTIDDISFKLGMQVKPLLALESDIMNAIGVYYEGKAPDQSFRMAKEKLAEFDASLVSHKVDEGPLGVVGEGGGRGSDQETSKQKADISQKVVIESLIELLVSKGIFTREELIKRIKSRGRS